VSVEYGLNNEKATVISQIGLSIPGKTRRQPRDLEAKCLARSETQPSGKGLVFLL
jgi:hypothetical protein